MFSAICKPALMWLMQLWWISKFQSIWKMKEQWKQLVICKIHELYSRNVLRIVIQSDFKFLAGREEETFLRLNTN